MVKGKCGSWEARGGGAGREGSYVLFVGVEEFKQLSDVYLL